MLPCTTGKATLGSVCQQADMSLRIWLVLPSVFLSTGNEKKKKNSVTHLDQAQAHFHISTEGLYQKELIKETGAVTLQYKRSYLYLQKG